MGPSLPEPKPGADALRALLEGAAVTAAERVALLSGAVAVLAVELSGAARGDDRLLNLVWFCAEARWAVTTCVAIGPTCYALVRPDGADLAGAVESVVAEVGRALGAEARAGVSAPAHAPRDLSAARQEADRALAVVRDRDGERVAAFDDVRSLVALADLRGVVSDWPDLHSPKLAALRAYDEAEGTDYVTNLRVYLDSLGDVPAAARRLGVHANTLRYRLRRMVDRAGIDLRDTDELLTFALELA